MHSLKLYIYIFIYIYMTDTRSTQQLHPSVEALFEAAKKNPAAYTPLSPIQAFPAPATAAPASINRNRANYITPQEAKAEQSAAETIYAISAHGTEFPNLIIPVHDGIKVNYYCPRSHILDCPTQTQSALCSDTLGIKPCDTYPNTMLYGYPEMLFTPDEEKYFFSGIICCKCKTGWGIGKLKVEPRAKYNGPCPWLILDIDKRPPNNYPFLSECLTWILKHNQKCHRTTTPNVHILTCRALTGQNPRKMIKIKQDPKSRKFSQKYYYRRKGHGGGKRKTRKRRKTKKRALYKNYYKNY